MRIAVNTRFLLPNRLEGIGWFTYQVLKHWVDQHPEHEFIFIFDRPYDQQFIFGDNVEAVYTKIPARHPVLFYYWFEWAIPSILKKYKADVFVSTDGFMSLKTKVPTLLVIHDIAWKHYSAQVKWSHQKYYEYFMPKFAQKAKRIATVSTYSKMDIHQYLDISKEAIDVVYNGADERFHSLSLEEKQAVRQEYAEGKPYFLYVGSVHPRKNVANLLRAFDLFKKQTDSEAKLLLGGRIAWKAGEVKEVYEQMGAKNDVCFLGYVQDIDLPRIVAGAYALSYVSKFEGFGVPILEALYAEVPVITSNTSSMPEVAGEAGILIDPFSVDSIASGMKALWEDVDLYEEKVRLGRAQKQLFNWQKTADKLWASLEQTIDFR